MPLDERSGGAVRRLREATRSPCGSSTGPELVRILVEGEMGTRQMVVAEVTGHEAAEMSLTEDVHRIEPMSRSANGFCQSSAVP
jgi:hypothetical protein